MSFRFHLVSLTAVFFALAIGVAMGATVVDRVTVDAVESQLAGVERRSDRVNAENVSLQAQLRQWETWSGDAGQSFVQARLVGVPVVAVGVRGVGVDDAKRLHEALDAARAVLQGTVWFTARMRLERPADTAELSALVGAPDGDPDAVRRAALAAIGRRWVDVTAEQALLPRLRDAGFVEFEAAEDADVDLSAVPTVGARTLVFSSDRAEVANDLLAIPFVEAIAGTGRVVVADLTAPPPIDRPVAPFVTAVRENAAVAGRISTVDDAAHFRGRISVVLAMAAVGEARYGHYGIGPRAQRTIPPGP